MFNRGGFCNYLNHNSWTHTYANDVNLDWVFSKTR